VPVVSCALTTTLMESQRVLIPTFSPALRDVTGDFKGNVSSDVVLDAEYNCLG
jgi:hypothetical protein